MTQCVLSLKIGHKYQFEKLSVHIAELIDLEKSLLNPDRPLICLMMKSKSQCLQIHNGGERLQGSRVYLGIYCPLVVLRIERYEQL